MRVVRHSLLDAFREFFEYRVQIGHVHGGFMNEDRRLQRLSYSSGWFVKVGSPRTAVHA